MPLFGEAEGLKALFETEEYRRCRGAAMLVVLVAAGMALSLFESLLPRPLPFFRFGLANLATLWALFLLGGRGAVMVAFFRVLLVSLLTGGLFSPAFFFALAGSLSAALVEALLYRGTRRRISVILLSMIGAVSHNTAQWGILLLWVPLSVPQAERLLALLYLLALPMGLLVGLLAFLSSPVRTERLDVRMIPA